MRHNHGHPQALQEIRDPHWEARVRDSFARQKVMALLGAELADLGPGYCEISLPFRADLTQQNGYIHAGIVSTIVDSAGGYAGYTLMPAGTDVLTVEYKLNLLAPGEGDRLVATGEVTKAGKTLVITRGDVYAIKSGRSVHCATMQQTLITMRRQPGEERQ